MRFYGRPASQGRVETEFPLRRLPVNKSRDLEPSSGLERKDSPTTVYSDDWLPEQTGFELSAPFLVWQTTANCSI